MMQAQPRILLVPSLTELEWTNKPLLEEWADVASYDAPGVGSESPAQGLRLEATAERGLDELDRRGWERCVVAGDEFGSLAAVLLARAREKAVIGLALGHATASYRRSGDRPAVNPAVTDALAQLAEVDFKSFIRQEFRAWHGLRDALAEAPGPDEMADAYLDRVPHEVATTFYRELLEHEHELEGRVDGALRELSIPLLLVRHEGCLMFTKDGYDEIVAALPDAARATTTAKPTVDPAFSAILRDFCTKLAGEPQPARD
jgi:hypothetical protein